MLVARNAQGVLINLLDKIPEKGEFICPACAEPVRLRCGKVMRPHFAHISLKNCHFFQENESQEHLSLKAELYQSLSKCQEIQVEKYLPELGQIADLFVGERLALEVQCSILSNDRLKVRSQAYQEAGLHVLWLLGKKLWLGKRLTALHRDFLYFSQNLGFHLWELDLEKREVRLKYLIYQDWDGRLHYLEKSISFDGDLLAFFRSPYSRQRLESYQVKQNQNLLQDIQLALRKRHPVWLKRQEEAYSLGENLLTKSLDDFYPQVRLLDHEGGFCQVREDLSALSSAFSQYYQKQEEKKAQTLYPPVYYIKTLANAGQSATIKEKGDLP